VVSTNDTGAAEGVRHLLAAGHRRIAFLGDRPTIATAAQRYSGYADALREAGLPVDPALVVEGLRSPSDADGAVTTLLGRPDPPTAVFTAQNLLTAGAVRALRRARVHRDVALVGFDDILLADLLDPGITVVAQDPEAIGRIAAGLLFDRIAGGAGEPQVRFVPTTLIRRGSGEIPPPTR
jgi:LacI family transcriptional regulator